MASTMQGLQIAARSISLPTRLHHNSNRIETELNKLKCLEFSSASSIQTGLTRLAELYNCVEEVMQSPLTQAALHHHQEFVEEALEESIALLDVCGSVRDLLLTMKEQLQDLQSAFRRRGKDSSIESNVNSFISFRKKSRKIISRCIKALKKMESNSPETFSMLNVDHHVLLVDKILRKSREITITIFKSLLLFLSTPDSRTNATSKWSLISRLMKINCHQKIFSEVGTIDLALYSLHERIRKNDIAKVDDVQLVQRRLETLCCSIKGFENGFDCLFRRLIQNRVSLLNILAP